MGGRRRRTGDSQASGEDQHQHEVEGVEEDRHCFVPSEDEYAVDPVWDLYDGRDRAPFRLGIVCVGLASEPRAGLERLRLEEDYQS